MNPLMVVSSVGNASMQSCPMHPLPWTNRFADRAAKVLKGILSARSPPEIGVNVAGVVDQMRIIPIAMHNW